MHNQNKIKSVKIEFSEGNEKYYAFIDNEFIGKFYTFDEVIKGLRRHNDRDSIRNNEVRKK